MKAMPAKRNLQHKSFSVSIPSDGSIRVLFLHEIRGKITLPNRGRGTELRLDFSNTRLR